MHEVSSLMQAGILEVAFHESLFPGMAYPK